MGYVLRTLRGLLWHGPVMPRPESSSEQWVEKDDLSDLRSHVDVMNRGTCEHHTDSSKTQVGASEVPEQRPAVLDVAMLGKHGGEGQVSQADHKVSSLSLPSRGPRCSCWPQGSFRVAVPHCSLCVYKQSSRAEEDRERKCQ